MKNGFRIYDTDTHIEPGADVLAKYVDPGFRSRLDDLAPYRHAVKSRSADGAYGTSRSEPDRMRSVTLPASTRMMPSSTR